MHFGFLLHGEKSKKENVGVDNNHRQLLHSICSCIYIAMNEIAQSREAYEEMDSITS